ncbi:NADH-quinone oxidoreductase subunit C [bacterium]|nr:NADH-quinone oxidoreductase subunit C [bacterium]
MTMDALTARNGESFRTVDVPRLPADRFRREILDSVARGLRISTYFGFRPGAANTRLLCVLADDSEKTLSVLSCEPGGRFESLTPDCPQAHLFEREIAEQFGIVPEGHPWMKPVRYPDARDSIPGDTAFFSAEGEELHEVAVGPVHAGIIEPGHFRFQCRGEDVLHLEIQLGYQHRGAETLLESSPAPRAMAVAESIAGDTAIGHALAYCAVHESLSSGAVPPRAEAIRAVALELERLANHVGDLGALCGDVGFLPSAAYFGRLRGEFLNLLMDLSGNRNGRSLIRPGGVRFDLTADMAGDFSERIGRAERDIASAADLMFETPSVQARFEGTGRISERACRDLGLVGPTARACGVPRDVRSDHPHGAYRSARIPVSTIEGGDVYARAMLKHLEIARSISFLLSQIQDLPAGTLKQPCAAARPGRMAVSLVEGWRGEIAHAGITGESGEILRYKVKDPSFHNWTALAMALRDTPISDFPLCNKSFNLSYAGHDL